MARRWNGAAAIGAAALALSGGGRPALAAEDCRMVKVAELPVKFEHNRPMIPVSINGRPAWFLAETGAASTVMFGGAAKALGLGETTAEGVRFYGVGGGQQANVAVVRELQISGVRVKDIRMFVIRADGSPEFAGLLGRDLLGHWDIEFDLASKTIRL